MKDHVDASTLAEHQEGLLPRRQRAQIASHLAACYECAELSDQLASVSALLAAAPAPPMPAGLAARLDAVLAAEAAGRARAGASVSAEAAGRARAGAAVSAGAEDDEAPAVAGTRRTAAGRRRRWLPRLRIESLSLRLAAAAAAATLVGGGGYALSQMAGSTGSSGGTAGAGASSRVAAGARAAAGPNPIYGPDQAVPYPVVTSRTNYQPGALPRQIRPVVARYAYTHSSYLPYPVVTHKTPMPAPRAAGLVDPCVRGLRAGRQPSLVVVARYAGRPAAVIVVPSAHGQVAWVVATSGGTCPAGHPHVLAKVVLPAR